MLRRNPGNKPLVRLGRPRTRELRERSYGNHPGVQRCMTSHSPSLLVLGLQRGRERQMERRLRVRGGRDRYHGGGVGRMSFFLRAGDRHRLSGTAEMA